MLASCFSRKDEPGPTAEENKEICVERREYGVAVLENRNGNFLGKADGIARPAECQSEVCGHAFKGQRVAGPCTFFPALTAASAQARRRRVWPCEGWMLIGFPWFEEGAQLCQMSARSDLDGVARLRSRGAC